MKVCTFVPKNLRLQHFSAEGLTFVKRECTTVSMLLNLKSELQGKETDILTVLGENNE